MLYTYRWHGSKAQTARRCTMRALCGMSRDLVAWMVKRTEDSYFIVGQLNMFYLFAIPGDIRYINTY